MIDDEYEHLMDKKVATQASHVKEFPQPVPVPEPLPEPELVPPQPASQLQVVAPAKRTKSILKSPSSTTDKSIYFDDKLNEIVNKIQIDQTSETTLPTKTSILPSVQPIMPIPKKNERSFLNEIDSIKRMLLEPQLKYKFFDNSRETKENTGRNPLLRSRTERVFIKSPTPMRELPAFENSLKQQTEAAVISTVTHNSKENELDGEGSGKNRNRFVKKKLALRSQSAELSKLIGTSSLHTNLDEAVNSRQTMQPTIRITSPPNTRRNLTRQNAFTKSLGDNLNKIHHSTRQDGRKNSNRHHHHHHRHHHRSSHRNHPNSHHHKLSNKKSHYKSSSLTSTSSSSLVSSDLATKSESSFTSSTTSSSSLLSDYTNEQSKKHVNFTEDISRIGTIPGFKITSLKFLWSEKYHRLCISYLVPVISRWLTPG